MKFTVYSREGCPFCEKIKQVLQLGEFQYVVYELGTNFTREEFYAEFGNGSTFPQVILDDTQKLGGCQETVRYLQEKKLL